MTEHVPSSIVLQIPSWVHDKIGPERPVHRSAQEQMAFVLDLATENVTQGAGPFAAAVYSDDGELVSVGINRVVADAAPIAHAEIMAIAAAGQALGRWDFAGQGRYRLVSSTEPCAMCLGAVPWSGVRGLVIGARDEDARAAGFDEGNKPTNWLQHLDEIGIVVTRDVGRDQAAKVMLDYKNSGAPIYNGGTTAG